MRSHQRRSSPLAFTLVELVCVIVSIGFIGAIAMPRYAQAISHYRLSAACNRIVTDIDLARSAAMSSGSSQTITYNAVANTYTVTGMISLENNSSSYSVKLGAAPYMADLVTVNFGASRQTLTFDPYGMPDYSGTLTVSVGGVTKTITVEATTGKTTVQ